MRIKKPLYIDEDLKIYDKEFNDNRLFINFANWNQELTNHIKTKNDFDRINYWRYLNSKNKNEYLIKINRIFNSIIEIDKNIVNMSNEFYNKNLLGSFVIGIHYRACAVSNCEKVNTNQINFYLSINKILDNIDKFINENCINNYKIYLATDCKEILYKFINKYKTNLIYNKENIWMSDKCTGIEPHFGFELTDNNMTNSKFVEYFNKHKPGLNGGIQLMKDVLVLSKCDIFFASLSNMSDIVQILNPNMKVINY